MSKLKLTKSLHILCIIQLIILLLAVGNFFITKSSLFHQTFLPSDLGCDAIFRSEEQITIHPNNASGATIVSTDTMNLPRGSYIVHLYYTTDTDLNSLVGFSPDIPYSHFLCNANTLEKEQNIATLSLRIKSAGEVTIVTNYSGEGSLNISEISIYETTDMAKQDFVCAFFFCIFLSVIYYMCTTTLTKRKVILALLAIIFASSYPLMVDYMIIGHDLPFHLNRIEGIRTGIMQCIFPVKIHPFWAYDYGYASGVFYGDLLLYFPVLLRMLGFTIQASYMTFVFCVNVATVLISYFCFKKVFHHSKYGLLACMLYSLSLYRLVDVYTRAAVGEFCAMMFLPLILLGLYEIFTLKNQDNFLKPSLLLTLGLTGIINTHLLTCEMVAIFIVITCLVCIKRVLQLRTFLALLLTVCFTLLLNAGFLVPFLDYYFTESFMINSDSFGSTSVQNLGLFFAQIFSIFQEADGGTRPTTNGIICEFTPGLGLALVVGFLGCIYFLFTSSKEERKHSDFKLTTYTFLLAIISIFMSSYLFPWDALSKLGKMGNSLVKSLQFPWRFLTLVTLFITVCIVLVIKQVSKRTHTNVSLPFGTTATLILCGCVVIGSGWYYHDFLSVGNAYRVYDTYELNSTQMYGCEYLPENTVLNDIRINRYETSDGISISSIKKEGTTILCQVTNNASDGYIEVPLTLYKGYQAIDVETGKKLTISNGYNNCIKVDIPKNFDGTINISFHSPIYWEIAEWISFVSLVILLATVILSMIKEKKLQKL